MAVVTYRASFTKAFKKLSTKRQDAVTEAVEFCLNSIGLGKRPIKGLGLKKLKESYWEIRSTLADRIIFEWANDTFDFRLVGNHDDVRRFLRG